MSKVQVLFPGERFRSKFFDLSDIVAMRSSYVTVAEFEVDETAVDAAEEAFSISNNPFRNSDRAVYFKQLRSLSVGDIVVVDSVEYACMPVGWKVIQSE